MPDPEKADKLNFDAFRVISVSVHEELHRGS
jgi:hypothetical protein